MKVIFILLVLQINKKIFQGQRGPATWFYPFSFVKHKAKMEVLPAGSLTRVEVHHKSGASLRDGANPVFGIRPDVPGGPDQFYKPNDIIVKK